MSTFTHKKPDYDYLLKLEHWSKKDAALIISGKDPEDFRNIRFTGNNLPEELVDAYKLYKIFLSYDRYSDYRNQLGDPRTYINLASKKDWPIPEDLLNACSKLIARNKERAVLAEQSEQEIKEAEYDNGARARKYLLKIIGVLTELDESKNNPIPISIPLHERQIVVSSIVEDILQFKEDNDLQITGLGKSNLHEKISEGLKVVWEEYEG